MRKLDASLDLFEHFRPEHCSRRGFDQVDVKQSRKIYFRGQPLKRAGDSAVALKVHTRIEEEILYPEERGTVEDDMLDEAYVEHDGAKKLIAEIEGMQPSESLYDAKVKVLGEYIKHHVKEEEQPGGIFAQAKKGDEDLDAMGERIKARKEELMAKMGGGKN